MKHMLRRHLLGMLMVAATLGLAGPVWAEEPKILGSYKAWDAYKLTRDGNTICYVVSQPTDTQPKNVRRGDIFFIVSNWANLNIKGQPSVVTGYTYRDGSTTTAKIGSEKFNFFTQGDGAWMRESANEQKIISAMRRGTTMIITGTSSRGTLTTDRYSLAGVSAALEKINQVCG